jgi:REP element-mobilizing transposase RayT
VTKCVEPRENIIDDLVASEICSALCFCGQKGLIYLKAFVVMLDHWHALLATCDGRSISERLKILDQWLSRKTSKMLATNSERLALRKDRRWDSVHCDWQQGFHETWIRSARQFQFVSVYIEENPVRAGLVDSPSEWRWSSANPRYRRFLTNPWPWRFEKD